MSGKYNYTGLTDSEVQQSRKEYGKNELPPPKIETFWEKLMENFEDPLIKILCVALVITVILSFLGYAEWFEGVGIAVAVFLATFVATFSEYKNEESFQRLQEQASRAKNTVIRNGQVASILVTDVVRGDYVILQAGDKVPADGRLIHGSLGSNQSSLTGEPEPVKKVVAPERYNPVKRDLNDEHLVFRGSVIEEGEGVMVVDGVGTSTLYGKLIEEIVSKDDDEEERKSPLSVKLSKLADQIANVGYIGAVFIFMSFLFKQFVMDQGYDLSKTIEYIKHWQLALHDTVTALILAIIIIVVAVPEGLPMMIAIVLSLNMKKLLDQKVLVRQLLGIETAGSLNILFTDKTGTLTHGTLEPHQFVTGNLSNYDLHHKDDIPKELKSILHFSLKHSTASHVDPKGNIVGGNSSDRAFLTLLDKDYLRQDENVQVVNEILFTSSIKFSARSLEVSDKASKSYPSGFLKQGKITIVKGAPEKLLPSCSSYFTSHGQQQIIEDSSPLLQRVDDMSHAGVRVIAIAVSEGELDTNKKAIPSKMTLVGFLGLRDEIRKESRKAVATCKSAGIQVVMITGDRKETAISIAREVGLLPHTVTLSEEGSDRHLPRNAVLTSDDLNEMTDDELRAVLPEVCVIARALPTDKSRLVSVSQSRNQVVGMTGDGVNDAAALKKADVGFAMGSGTEMAKEAADIVIMDDNFNSITRAILYGRTIFKSIRKFIIFQSTINVASTLIVFLGPFLGIDFPLTLIQLLWVNLVMDTLAALAFGGEAALERYMLEKPIRRDDAIVSPYMWSQILFNGVFIAFVSLFVLMNSYVANMFQRNGVPDQPAFLTAFFGFYIFITTINALNVRTHHINVFEGIFENMGFLLVLGVIFFVQITFTYIGGAVLRTVPLSSNEWIWIIGASFVIIPWDTIRKVAVAPWLPTRLVDTTGLEPQEDDDSDEGEDKKKK
eukprot:TRINITY_DN4607_c0_g1_i1.p1 TRINITY_DN4607_c0_g1~~TRINITY_DN4607_c0_g1_i1.p1  ORF type:complete len:947 (-),score=285.47 TRINITY_DN4607_c0_g1_i1:192-3032(-)